MVPEFGTGLLTRNIQVLLLHTVEITKIYLHTHIFDKNFVKATKLSTKELLICKKIQ